MKTALLAVKTTISFVALALLFAFPSAAATLHNYPCGSGIGYEGGLTKDNGGNYYGVSGLGGTWNVGIAFKLSPDVHGGWNCNVIHTFLPDIGPANPEVTLVMDGQGNLYGTSTAGGEANAGTIFELSNQDGSWQVINEYDFTGRADGSYPLGALAMDAAGNVYGTASQGGSGGGTVFELTPGTWTFRTIHTFGPIPDGSIPIGGVVIDRAGNLYGTTWEGGTGGTGVVFKLHAAGQGWVETILHAFTDSDEGNQPQSAPSFDSQGNLYGSVVSGAIYKITPPPNAPRSVEQPWPITWIYQFPGASNLADGYFPIGAPIVDSSGNIYGATSEGGDTNACPPNGCGVIYKLVPSHDNGPTTWTETVLWTFEGYPNGQYPDSILTFDSSGNLLSTTSDDGPFSLTP